MPAPTDGHDDAALEDAFLKDLAELAGVEPETIEELDSEDGHGQDTEC